MAYEVSHVRALESEAVFIMREVAAELELSSRGWRGVAMTPKTVAEIERLRRAEPASGKAEPTAEREVEVAA